MTASCRSSVGRRRPLDRTTGVGRAIIDAETVHYPDIESLDPVAFATARGIAKEFGFRAALVAPMLREDMAIGASACARSSPAPSRRVRSSCSKPSRPRR